MPSEASHGPLNVLIGDVSIDLGGLNGFMPERFLNGSD